MLMDEDVRLTRLPVTSVKFFNPPGDVNQDHYKILVATCNLFILCVFSEFVNIRYFKMWLVI